MKTDWVEIDPNDIICSASSTLTVVDEETAERISSPRLGTLIFVKDTGKFYVWDWNHVPYKRPTFWQRLRRLVWHV